MPSPHRLADGSEVIVGFIFGLKRLEEIEAAFPGRLYEMLTSHFAADSQSGR